MGRFKLTQINFIPKKKKFLGLMQKGRPSGENAVEGEQAEGETDVWLTPKAEIMTHQGFQ